MSFKAGLRHVLRHCWLWPIQYWLRPLDMMDRMQKCQIAEVWAGVLGSAILGAVLGIPIWLATGETSAIWGLAVAVAVAVVFAAVFAFAGTVAFVYAGSVAVAVTVAGAGAAAGVVAVAVAGAGTVVGMGVGVGIGAAVPVAVIYFIVTAVLGLLIGIFLPSIVSGLLAISGGLVLILGPFMAYRSLADRPVFSGLAKIWGILLFLVLPIAGWAAFPQTMVKLMPVWGWSLIIPLSLGLIAGVYGDNEGLWNSRHSQNLQNSNQADKTWLVLLWVLGSVLALAAWLPNIQANDLNAKLDQLAVYLALMPPIATGLPFWPLLCLWALWQFRTARIKRYTFETFSNTLPFRWQTFAYPLPGLRSFLFKLCQVQGAKAAFDAIQKVQLGSLQISQARRAAFDLSQNPATALPFCGYIAIITNTATLTPLSITGPIARAVAVLAGKPEKEEKQPLRIFVGDYPPKPSKLPPPFGKPIPAWLEEFETSRQSGLEARLYYALAQFGEVVVVGRNKVAQRPFPAFRGHHLLCRKRPPGRAYSGLHCLAGPPLACPAHDPELGRNENQ